MNATNFEKLVAEKLIPKFPLQSVIVLDDAPVTVTRVTNRRHLRQQTQI